jgi:hypothetical protein
MSALGQKQTLAHVRVISALPPKADIVEQDRDVCFVPFADDVQRGNTGRYSITSSTLTKSDTGNAADRLGQFTPP